MSIELERIGWENGTITSKAKVNVGNMIYEVEPAQYSGKTPLSAENLKKMETNTENAINKAVANSFINAYLSAQQEMSKTTDRTLYLTTSDVEGDFFELDETNYCVKVKKDCCAMISASSFVESAGGEGIVRLKTVINNAVFSSDLVRIISRDYIQNVIPAKAINLKQNDTIQLKIDYTSDSGNPKINNSNFITYLSVIKI